MKTIFKIYIMVVRHCAWQILSSLGAELLVAMLGPIGLQVYEKLVDCLEKCLIYGHIRRFAN